MVLVGARQKKARKCWEATRSWGFPRKVFAILSPLFLLAALTVTGLFIYSLTQTVAFDLDTGEFEGWNKPALIALAGLFFIPAGFFTCYVVREEDDYGAYEIPMIWIVIICASGFPIMHLILALSPGSTADYIASNDAKAVDAAMIDTQGKGRRDRVILESSASDSINTAVQQAARDSDAHLYFYKNADGTYSWVEVELINPHSSILKRSAEFEVKVLQNMTAEEGSKVKYLLKK